MRRRPNLLAAPLRDAKIEARQRIIHSLGRTRRGKRGLGGGKLRRAVGKLCQRWRSCASLQPSCLPSRVGWRGRARTTARCFVSSTYSAARNASRRPNGHWRGASSRLQHELPARFRTCPRWRIAKNAIGGRCRRRGAAGARPVRARQNGLRTRSRENALNGAPTPIRYVSNRSCRAETGALTTPWNGPIALPEMAKLRGPAAELVQSRSGATALAGTCGLAERSPGLRCPSAAL